MTTAEDIQSILQREANAILNIPISDAFEKAISLIVEQVHRKKGKLVTSGMGKAGQIAMNIATTFCSTGIPSVFLHPSEAQHGDLGVLQENDLMLVISNSGKTREILELLVLASRLQPDLRFIVITGNPDSQLVVGTMKATGFDSSQYALRHHGGYLGQLSREQSCDDKK